MLFSSLIAFALFFTPAAVAESALPIPETLQENYKIEFTNIPMVEFIHFVSRVCQVNFLFDQEELDFSVTLAAGTTLSADQVLNSLMQMLRTRGFAIGEKEGCYVVHRAYQFDGSGGELFSTIDQSFLISKLQYHQGSDLQAVLKQTAQAGKSQGRGSQQLLDAIDSMQWIEGSNSLLYSGEKQALETLRQLIATLDTPPKQVFIELLVLRTQGENTFNVGMQSQGQIGEKGKNKPLLAASNMQKSTTVDMDNSIAPSLELGGDAFNLGIIGNFIFHKQKYHLSLSSLIHALQKDRESSIILNQKVITRDNRNSSIFVGENIPFTGSVVQNLGPTQQMTSNIDYRDIGVNLNITPLVGDDDIVTLDIKEEITEATDLSEQSQTGGIHTTKTNMVTCAHVPDGHFLVISGMMRTANTAQSSGIPLLEAIPLLGAFFGKKYNHCERSHVLIFVCPRVVHDFATHRDLTIAEKNKAIVNVDNSALKALVDKSIPAASVVE